MEFLIYKIEMIDIFWYKIYKMLKNIYIYN